MAGKTYRYAFKIDGDPTSGVKAIKATDKELAALDKRHKNVSKSSRTLGGDTKNLITKLGGLKSIAAGAFAGFVLTKAIQESRDFEVGLVGVSKTTGIVGVDLRSLAADIDGLSKTIPVSTDELLGLAQSAGQLGVKGRDNILEFTTVIAKLGRASDLAGEEAATSLARILNVMGEEASTVGTLASVIVSLGNNVAATESEIARITTEVARSTAVFEIGSAQSAALGAAMASLGIRAELGGSSVGRTLQEINLAVSAGGPVLDKFATTLNLSGDALANAYAEDKVQAFNMFLDGVASLGLDAGAALKELNLGGQEIAKTILPLAKNMDVYRQTQALANAEIKNATALDKEFEASLKTFGSSWTTFTNVIESAAKMLGDTLLPPLTNVLNIINEFAADGGLEKLTRGLKDLALVVAVGGGLYVGLTALQVVTTSVTAALGAMVSAAILGTGVSVFATFAAGVAKVKIALMGLAAAATLANSTIPIVGTAMAAVAFGTYLSRIKEVKIVTASVIKSLVTGWLYAKQKVAQAIAFISERGEERNKIIDQLALNYLREVQEVVNITNQMQLNAAGLNKVNKGLKEHTDNLKNDGDELENVTTDVLALTDAEKSLLDKLLPLEVAQKEAAAQMAVLDGLLARNAISADQYAVAVDNLKQKFADLYPEIAQDKLLAKLLPLEVAASEYTDSLASLNAMLASGKVTTDQYTTAVENLKKGYDELFPQSEMAKVFEEAWRNSIERVDDAFFSLFRSAFSGFSNLKDQMIETAKDLIAQIAYTFAKNKLMVNIGLGGSLTGLAGAAIGSTPSTVTSGASGAGGLAGIGSALTGGLTSINQTLANYLPSGFGGNLSAGGSVIDAGYGNTFNTGIDFTSLGLGIVGSFAGGAVGNAFGKALFGKEAESAFGQTLGSVVGAFWGPLGATIGSFIGSLADVAFGGDGQKRVNVGIQTGRWDDNVTASAVGASGLQLFSKSKRSGQAGSDAAAQMLDMFTALDNQLTAVTRAAGIAVDFSNTSLAGRSSEAGSNGPRDFFGSAGMNGVDTDQLAAAPADFVRAWIDEATKAFAGGGAQLATGFEGALAELDLSDLPANIRSNLQQYRESIVSATDAEFRQVVMGLQGDAEELLSGYASALSLKGVFDQGGKLFADIDGFKATFEILGDTFQREGEALGDTIERLATSGGVLQFLGVADEFTTVTATMGQELADAVGGVENLTALTSQFAEMFTTQEEVLATLGDQVDQVFASFGDTFDELGLIVPTTKAEFKTLVQSLDLSKTGATDLLAALLQIAPAFATVADATLSQAAATDTLVESAVNAEDYFNSLESTIDDLSGQVEILDSVVAPAADSVADLSAEISALEQSLAQQAAALFGSDATGALAGLIAQEKARIALLNDAAKTQASAANQQAKAAAEIYKSEMARYQDALKASDALGAATNKLALSDDSILTPMQKLAEAQSQFDTLVAAGQGGDAKSAQEAAGFASTLLSIGRDVFASGGDYTELFKATNSSLGGLAGLFGSATAPGGAPGGGSVSADTITSTPELESLLAQQAALIAQEQIQARNADLQAFADKLGTLALAKDQSIFDLIDSMGLGLDDLAADLNFDGLIDTMELAAAYLKLIDTNNDNFITTLETFNAGLAADSPIVKAIIESGANPWTGSAIADLVGLVDLPTPNPAGGGSDQPGPGSATDDLYNQRKWKRAYRDKGGSLEYADWLAAGAGTFDEIGFGSGAMVSKPTRAWIAEAGQSEAVVPLNEFWNKFDRLEAAVIKLQAIQTAQTEQQFNVAKVQIEQGEDLRAAVNDGAKKTASAFATKRKTTF